MQLNEVLAKKMEFMMKALGQMYAKRYNDKLGKAKHEAFTRGYVQGMQAFKEPELDADFDRIHRIHSMT